jgi:hypothetical protein
MNIEISYMILFASIIIVGILTITRKMSMGIGIAGIGSGLLIAWLLSPYMAIVIEPVGQFLFYGGDLTLSAMLGIGHLASLIVMTGMAGYNLMSSGGKIIWA